MILKMTRGLICVSLLAIICPAEASAGAYSHFIESRTDILPANGAKKVMLSAPQNISGRIRIQSVEKDVASVAIEYEGRTSDEAEFRRFLDLVEINIFRKGDKAVVAVSTADNAPWEGSDKSILLNMNFTLPEKMAVEVEGRFYSIEVLGSFQGLEIDNDYGEVYAHQIKGPVNIRTSFKDVTLGDVEGEVSILNNSGSIEAFNINCGSGKCRFETTVGKIKLENIIGEVEAITSYKPIILKGVNAGGGMILATNNYGEIRLDDVRGKLEIKTNFSRIQGDIINLSPGNSMVSGGYAEIELDRIRLDNSDLSISNNFSDVRAVFTGKTSAHFMLATDEGGGIHIKGIPLKPVSVTRNGFEGIVGEGESTLEINIRGIGRIDVLGNSGTAY